MEKFKKPEQFYIDEYDKGTIEILKALEMDMLNAEAEYAANDDDSSLEVLKNYISKRFRFREKAISLNRVKNEVIAKRIEADEQKDRKVKLYPVPMGIQCHTCGSKMNFLEYDFMDRAQEILFLFSCPKGHVPVKIVYGNGSEFVLPERRCEKCNGKFVSEKIRTDTAIKITSICLTCHYEEVLDFEIPSRIEGPIDEIERKKYCTDFESQKSFIEELKALAVLTESFGKSEIKELYEVDKIESLKVSQLEIRLKERLVKSGYDKLVFDKPKTGAQVVITFSIQDTTDRLSAKSISLLKKEIKNELLPTNWRLMATDVSYRMGHLEGQLKGVDSDEDMIKIAREIKENKDKTARS